MIRFLLSAVLALIAASADAQELRTGMRIVVVGSHQFMVESETVNRDGVPVAAGTLCAAREHGTLELVTIGPYSSVAVYTAPDRNVQQCPDGRVAVPNAHLRLLLKSSAVWSGENADCFLRSLGESRPSYCR